MTGKVIMQNKNRLQTYSDKVLVVGGGLGGIRAALDLAEAEKNVILVDRDYTIGGLMTQLDRTFPTNNCDLCTLAPQLSESGRQEYIELMTRTSVQSITGEKGDFTVSVRTDPRYINEDKCTACGACLNSSLNVSVLPRDLTTGRRHVCVTHRRSLRPIQ